MECVNATHQRKISMIYYISDPHFYHTNIIELANRPFSNVYEMNNVLIGKWNRKVNKGDRVFIIGDFSLGTKEQTLKILNKLNGEKILIRGNHESVIDYAEVKSKFGFIKDYYCKDKIVMSHYPFMSWRGKHNGYIHLYGHTHNNYPPLRIEGAYNCCVEVNNYEPCTLDEIIENNNIWWNKCET